MQQDGEKKIITDLQGKSAFLESLNEKIVDSVRTVDNHANVMIGINTVIFALVISMLFEIDHLKLTIGMVAIFSALSTIAAVFAIRLPRSFFKKKHPESIFYARRIAEYTSADEYARALRDVVTNEKEFFTQYAREAYNLSNYYYIPKRRMLTVSRYIFLFGVVMSSLFLLMEKLHWFVR